MPDIRVCFSYTNTDAPSDGSNTFTRVLRQQMSQASEFSIVDGLHGDYDVLFMNQLNRAPGVSYELPEISRALGGRKSKKLVVRAINLTRNTLNHDSPGRLQSHGADKPVLDLLTMADFVIFQSEFQKDFFGRAGYRGRKHTVIHNGAAPVFLDLPARIKKLEVKDDLILVSSAMARSAKRRDIVAALSLIPGVKVIHTGIWPDDLAKGNVNTVGVLSHKEMARVYESSHYFLHAATEDVCPNSLIEGLCAGLPAIYNPGRGSGRELGGRFGVPLDENDLPGTVRKAREKYVGLATSLLGDRQYYSIERAAPDYMQVFKTVAQG